MSKLRVVIAHPIPEGEPDQVVELDRQRANALIESGHVRLAPEPMEVAKPDAAGDQEKDSEATQDAQTEGKGKAKK